MSNHSRFGQRPENQMTLVPKAGIIDGHSYSEYTHLDGSRLHNWLSRSVCRKTATAPLGGFSEAAPPVPIPNTVVKRLSAYDTALARVWENWSLPGGFTVASGGLNGPLRPHLSQVFPLPFSQPPIRAHALHLRVSTHRRDVRLGGATPYFDLNGGGLQALSCYNEPLRDRVHACNCDQRD